MTRTATPSLDVDLFTDAALAAPWELHGRIRELAPAVWLPRHGVWATGRDDVVRNVLVDHERFSSAYGVGLRDNRSGSWQKPSAILELDPPDHTASRSVMHRLLSPRALRAMRGDFEAAAARIVDDAVGAGRIDGITDLALRFPSTVLPDVVGMRQEGREHIAVYNRMYFNGRVPDSERAVDSARAAARLGSVDWVRAQCRREHLAAGGFGDRLFQAADAGEIGHETAEGLVRTFIGAGIDTTVLAVGTMLHQLAVRPRAWRALRRDPERIRPLFDEALRWAPPASLIGRTATVAVDLGGVTVAPDERILCLVAGANRDPRRWDRPDDFDIERDAGGHLGFGIGLHFCVGHALARLEAEVLMTELAARVVSIELVGPPKPATTNWLLGLDALPLHLVAR